MGQLYVSVILRNAREYVMAQHGHLTFEAVHTYETPEALIDTGALHVVLPPHVAEHLGLWRMGYTGARLADGRTEEVPVTEPLYVELLGRTTTTQAMVMGDTVLLGAIVLEGLDLAVDCLRGQLMPNLGTRDQPLFRV
jgi:clan AA aspartic protease